MSDAAGFSARERLRDGRVLEIRALRPDDRADLIAAIGEASAQSLYRRFFSPKRHFTEQEVAYFLDIDFVDHVALVAVAEEQGRAVIVAGARYVVAEPGRAEIALTVVDRYQGQGIGSALLRHLAAIARDAGLKGLIADVLPDNTPILKLFEKSGLPLSKRRDRGVIHVTLALER